MDEFTLLYEKDRRELHILSKKLNFMLEDRRIRSMPFVRDYPSSLPQKRIDDFCRCKPKNSSSNWDKVDKIRCNVLAITHDYNRFVDYYMGTPVPDFSQS